MWEEKAFLGSELEVGPPQSLQNLFQPLDFFVKGLAEDDEVVNVYQHCPSLKALKCFLHKVFKAAWVLQ